MPTILEAKAETEDAGEKIESDAIYTRSVFESGAHGTNNDMMLSYYSVTFLRYIISMNNVTLYSPFQKTKKNK